MRSHSRSMSALAALFATLCGTLALSGAVQADELKVAPAQTSSVSNAPSRGMSMDKVEATFGAPARRVPAVGQPPISRWEYPGFTVYFEHNHVIHSVVSG